MSEADIAQFSPIPWCQTLLSDSKYVTVPTRSRYVKASGEDVLFGRTINTPSTISACLTQYRVPASEDGQIRELRTFIALGSALDGYPSVCHGGIQATILDEVMGLLLLEIKDQKCSQAQAAGAIPEVVDGVTAELTIKYLKPVVTPQTYCVTVQMTEHQGRKLWIEGAIEDSNKTPMATGRGLFIMVRSQKI